MLSLLKRKSVLFLVVLILLAAGFYPLFRDLKAPTVSLAPDSGTVSLSTPFTLTASDPESGIKGIRIAVDQRNRVTPLLEQTFPTANKTVAMQFSLQGIPLEDGQFNLLITAKDGSFAGFGKGNSGTVEKTLALDLKPPRVSVLSNTIYISRGGSACVVYTASEELSSSGVVAGDHFFPAYKQSDGTYASLFAFPYYLTMDTFRPSIRAVDLAGNVSERPFAPHLKDRLFKEDTLELPDSFLDQKMPEFEKYFPGNMSNLERYLKVNRDLRLANSQTLMELGRHSAPERLWEGAFTRAKGQPRAGFSDHRSYMYGGQLVDEQTHLGVDIAALEHFPVPAANAGKVIYADELGIYGNAIVIDHGQGLQTLYSHLSEIHVAVGDSILKDQIIGKTGATGLAGGDHLHFGVLLTGLPVTPVEWWDDHWIKDNINDRLK